MLTVAYMTNRRNPCFQWFRDSLRREMGDDLQKAQVVVVDYHAKEDGRGSEINFDGVDFVHTEPMGNVWQGPHRLTKRDYFAAANARNTAIIHAAGEFIVFVDDLSVLMPGWYAGVKRAIIGGYIVGGAYKKIRHLKVEDGVMVGGEEWAGGIDSRWKVGADVPVRINGGALFGCSMGGPIAAFEKVNGFDSDSDSVGGEDYLCGLMLERNGYQVFYDRSMLTYEWEEGHFFDPPFVRLDKGKSPNDKSHAILNMVNRGRHRAPNYFGEGGIAEVRRRVLAGEEQPIIRIPDRDWFDGQPLSEL